jgi:hypothetical protein
MRIHREARETSPPIHRVGLGIANMRCGSDTDPFYRMLGHKGNGRRTQDGHRSLLKRENPRLIAQAASAYRRLA